MCLKLIDPGEIRTGRRGPYLPGFCGLSVQIGFPRRTKLLTAESAHVAEAASSTNDLRSYCTFWYLAGMTFAAEILYRKRDETTDPEQSGLLGPCFSLPGLCTLRFKLLVFLVSATSQRQPLKFHRAGEIRL